MLQVSSYVAEDDTVIILIKLKASHGKSVSEYFKVTSAAIRLL
jgi:hypothetical protein